jgi:hypothetical protein
MAGDVQSDNERFPDGMRTVNGQIVTTSSKIQTSNQARLLLSKLTSDTQPRNPVNTVNPGSYVYVY